MDQDPSVAPVSPEPSQDQKTSKAPNVAKAGGIMVASLLLSRVLGLVRDFIIAGMFGADPNTDAYRLAFSVPDLLFFLISGGALSSAFIPVFSEYWHTQREEDAWKVFSGVTTIMSAIVLGFIVVAWIFATPLSQMIAPGANADSVAMIAYMSRILLPAQFAFFIGGLMFGTLYARQVFTVPGLGPNVYNIGIILGAVVLSGIVTPSVSGMSWGALVGAAIGNLLIPFFVLRKMGVQFKPSFDTSHPGVRKVFKLMLPVVLGLSLPGVFGLIMQAFGSYYPAGTNTVLDYSNKLMQAPLGVFGSSLAIAVFPALSQFFAQKEMDKFRRQLDTTLRTVMYLTVPVSVIMFVMAPQLSAAMYLHGKFTSEAAMRVADCLRFFSIGIWAWCLHPVLMRAFYSIQDTVTPVVLGTLCTGLFFALLLTLRNTALGYLALPLASSIAAISLVLMMAVVLAPKIGGMDIKNLVVTVGKCVVGSIAVGIAGAVVAYSPISDAIWGKKLPTLGVTFLALMVASWGYFFLTKALKMPESEWVDRALSKVKGKLGMPA